MKLKYLGAVVVLTMLLPLAASALSIDEIQQQINTLLAQVAQLQGQLKVLSGKTDPDTVTSTPNKHRVCDLLSRNLSQGIRGNDVHSLQEFLSTEGYLSASPTGFFGQMTAQALAKWQSSQGVQSVGSVGPKTRERIRIWCGGGAGNNQFSTTTTSGATSTFPSISVTSPVAGVNVARGGTTTISWSSQNAPVGSAVGIWLIKNGDAAPNKCDNDSVGTCGRINLGLIAGNQSTSTSGSYIWNVPTGSTSPICTESPTAFDCIKQYGNIPAPCPKDSAGVCGDSITAGAYRVVAKLYTPATACLWGYCWPNSAPTYLASSESGVFTIGAATPSTSPNTTGNSGSYFCFAGVSGYWSKAPCPSGG